MTPVRTFCILLLTIVLLSCSEDPENSGALKTGANMSGGSTRENSVTIGPVNAVIHSVITLQSDRSLLNNSRIQWYVNDNIVETSRGLRFVSKQLKKGDIVHAAVVTEDNTYLSNRITIINTPPTIRKARIHPPKPVASSTLTVKAEADDPDGDITGFRYKWYVNDRLAGDQSFLEHDFKRGDRVTVRVVPYDEDTEGRSVFLKKSIFNSLPTVTESSPVIDGKTYIYHVRANDPDGDTLSYKLEQGPDGMSIDPAGMITWEIPQETETEFDVKVSISDNHGGKILVPFTVKTGFEETEDE